MGVGGGQGDGKEGHYVVAYANSLRGPVKVREGAVPLLLLLLVAAAHLPLTLDPAHRMDDKVDEEAGGRTDLPLVRADCLGPLQGDIYPAPRAGRVRILQALAVVVAQDSAVQGEASGKGSGRAERAERSERSEGVWKKEKKLR